jgi:dihydroflavonol-4-reductase
MKILVTGGTGLVGGSIVRALLQQENQVRVLVRQKSKTEHLTAQGVEVAYGDILDIHSIRKALEGCDTLYHSAVAMFDTCGLSVDMILQTQAAGSLIEARDTHQETGW